MSTVSISGSEFDLRRIPVRRQSLTKKGGRGRFSITSWRIHEGFLKLMYVEESSRVNDKDLQGYADVVRISDYQSVSATTRLSTR